MISGDVAKGKKRDVGAGFVVLLLLPPLDVGGVPVLLSDIVSAMIYNVLSKFVNSMTSQLISVKWKASVFQQMGCLVFVHEG